MQQSLPYIRVWPPVSSQSSISQPPSVVVDDASRERVVKNVTDMVLENAVILLGRRGCCMCHAMKMLLQALGVNPTVYDMDEEDEIGVINELATIGGGGKDGRLQFPSVFIGGKLFGGLDRLMAAHISGELIPILKQAGALWL